MNVLRYILSITGGGIVALGLFVGMQALLKGEVELDQDDSESLSMEFIELKREPVVKEKKREKPEEPPPPKEPPPPPTIEAESMDDPTPNELNFDMPELDLAFSAGGGPAMGGIGGSAGQTGDRGLQPVFTIPPQYPTEAALEGIEGSVTFRITINPEGRVIDAQVLEYTDRVFIRPAQRVIYKWRFKPKVVDGKPVQATDTYIFPFSFADEE